MACSVGQYISELIGRAGLTQAEVAREIRVPRQLLSYVMSGKRELSLQLAMRLESFFSLSDGELVKLQAMQVVRHRKLAIRNRLCEKLMEKNAFWSFDVKCNDDIPNEEIVEQCFRLLDMEDIDLMFELYPHKYIRQVWRDRMAVQGEYMQMLNVMIALYYFRIKEPEKYLARLEKQHINRLLRDAIN